MHLTSGALSTALAALILLPAPAAAQSTAVPLESNAGLRLHNVSATPATWQDRKGLRIQLSEDVARRLKAMTPAEQQQAVQQGLAEQLAVIEASDFGNGVIEAEIAGAPRPDAGEGARGFVGIAFRLQDDLKTYDAFYLRPTNGRADDQVRRNHSAQYIAHPDFPWFRLRKEFPEKYEAYVDLVPGEWTKVRIEVSGTQARLFVHGQAQPTLIVNDVKSGATRPGQDRAVDRQRHGRALPQPDRDPGRRAGALDGRQPQADAQTAERPLGEGDRAAARGRQIPDDGQAEPRPWRGLVGAHATLEHHLPHRGGDTRTVVVDGHDDVLPHRAPPTRRPGGDPTCRRCRAGCRASRRDPRDRPGRPGRARRRPRWSDLARRAGGATSARAPPTIRRPASTCRVSAASRRPGPAPAGSRPAGACDRPARGSRLRGRPGRLHRRDPPPEAARPAASSTRAPDRRPRSAPAPRTPRADRAGR